MILWVADRFGMPGSYHRIWLRLLLQNGLQPHEFRIVKLSDAIKRTLLCKLGSRKAPTWIPAESPHIVAQIDRWIDQLKPRAVVLSSPESLAYLAMAPEHATLHNLRGSVYWRRGIPFIVSLPISAWTTLVSQKDVGAANYGFESAEGFAQSRSQGGEVYEDSDQRISRGLLASDRHHHESLEIENFARSPSGAGKVYGRTLPPAGTRIDLEAGNSENEIQETDNLGANLDGAVVAADDSDDTDDSRDDSDSDDVDNDVSSLASDDEDDVDRFFYEPVLSPVGRFVLTADMQKLERILEAGKRSDGPSKPIQLRY